MMMTREPKHSVLPYIIAQCNKIFVTGKYFIGQRPSHPPLSTNQNTDQWSHPHMPSFADALSTKLQKAPAWAAPQPPPPPPIALDCALALFPSHGTPGTHAFHRRLKLLRSVSAAAYYPISSPDWRRTQKPESRNRGKRWVCWGYLLRYHLGFCCCPSPRCLRSWLTLRRKTRQSERWRSSRDTHFGNRLLGSRILSLPCPSRAKIFKSR